jgi:OOP family OmpA-OmpF porin
VDDFEELRRLLLCREQEQLRELRDRVEDKEKRAQDISGVLPQAVILSRERGGELTRALQPTVEDSIRESIENQPQVFVDAFHPIIGPIVRRSIAESLRGLMQSLNQTLEHTFSWQGLKWRFEALRTGKSFAEVVLLRSLVYRVEQIFLIHRETSLPLLHVAADAAVTKDSEMVAGMLSAILDFTRDSFQAGEDATLEEFRVGELQVWIAPGRHAYLAAAIRGNPSRELHAALEEAIDNAHILKGSALRTFSGDASVFESLRLELEACLHAQYKQTQAAKGRNTKAWLALGAAAAALTAACVVMLRNEGRWRDFLGRLRAEPGIAVTTAHKSWLSASRVAGLRDPLAADPAPLAQQAGVDPARIHFEWKDYLALDSISVRRRFEQRFGVPAGVQVAVADGVLNIAGPVPYEWIERVRRESPQLPGVNSLAEQGVKVTYDSALVLKRFQAAFPLPPQVTAGYENGTLRLAGKAAYEWIAPVREGAARLPGISAISEKELVVAFDPALVLKRFESRFGLPDTVSAAMQNGALTLSGEASHAWLTRVRKGATEVPGIASLDERNLIDLDQQTFQQSKSVIESAFVYFLVNKDNFATEGFAALSRLPDEIRRCQTAAKRIGTEISIEIRGSADAVGSEAKNVDLSQRRAHAVREFLVSCGLDAAMLKPLALGAPSAAGAGGKPGPEESDRRVAFRIISHP